MTLGWIVAALTPGVPRWTRRLALATFVGTLAQAPLDGTTAPRLIQVDSRYTLKNADRGRPHVGALVPEAWNAGPLRLLNPIAATVTASDTDLPRIRFVMDALVPVVRGTRRIRESREE